MFSLRTFLIPYTTCIYCSSSPYHYKYYTNLTINTSLTLSNTYIQGSSVNPTYSISSSFCDFNSSYIMSSIVALLLLSCISMCACNARLLGFIDKQSGNNKAYHSVEDGEKVLRLLSETSMSSSTPRPSISEQVEVITLSSQIHDQKQSIKMKGLKRHARSLLRSATHAMQEDIDSKGNKASDEDDVGVMDYAQPHRKPPIHNQKP